MDVTVYWHGGLMTRHMIRQGLRTYCSLAGLERLGERILELRGDGRTADAIATVLNREGYRPARGTEFTGALVRKLLAWFGQSGLPPGVRNASDLPGRHEFWLPKLAGQLDVKPIVLHGWRWSGWLHSHHLRGEAEWRQLMARSSAS